MRVRNFYPGPATLPLPALERAQRELLDIEGSGMSVMEQSHRAPLYEGIHAEAKALLVELMGIPDTHEVLFVQGGASQQFAWVPLNFLHPEQSADYLVTGVWGEKALAEAKTIGKARAGNPLPENGKYTRIPEPGELQLSHDAAYVHITTNNTVSGTQWHDYPSTGKVPLVADMSSDILSRKIDVSRFGLIYAGAQKNLGPSGVTVVIVDRDWVARSARSDIPRIFRYATHIKADSLYNTPPTFAVYLLRNVLSVFKAEGGVDEFERRNKEKAEMLYNAISARPEVYRCPVAQDSRSVMNVVFNLPTEEAEKRFVAEATAAGFVGLKGHRLVGGIRASLYNAVSREWVAALTDFMAAFQL